MVKPIAVVSVAAAALLVARPSHAYLDPGTGSMVLQAIVAAIAVASAGVAAFWGRIRQLFGRTRGAQPPVDRDPGAPPA